MKIPFLKIGKWKNSVDGKTIAFEEADLDKVITATQKFPYQENQFPLCIGHVKTDSPAYGWVKKENVHKVLFTENEPGLIALADNNDLVPEFVGWFGKKLYKNVSVKLRPDYSIQHIAFLGAQGPSVKGLPSVALEDSEEGTSIEFAEYEISSWYFNTLGRVIRRMKNFLVDLKGLDDAEKIMPEYELSDLGVPPKIYEVKKNYSFEENNPNQLTEIEMDELTKIKAEKLALETELASTKTKLQTVETSLSEKERASLEASMMAFCESDDVKLKIKPAEKQTVVSVLVDLQQQKPIEFAEGTEKKQVNPVDFVKDLLKRLPDVVEFGEKFNKGTGDDISEDIKIGQSIADMVNKQ